MKFKAKEIADLLEGVVDGNPEETVTKLSKIEHGEPSSLSFLANPKYTPYIYTTEASVVIVDKTFVPERPLKCTLVKVENAYTSFAKLLEIYDQINRNKTGISEKAFIAPSATVGKNVYIGEFAVISENAMINDNAKIYPQVFIGENVKIGTYTTLFAGVKIYSDNVIGNNCTLHAGVVIGADGFGFAPQEDNNYQKVPQIGNVIIEDNVEIGANTTIDRATLGSTIIRRGVKLDNLIQVAHNVEIGENTVIAAQTGVSGSTKIGKNCMIGGQVGIVGHITIGDKVQIGAQSGIGSNIKEGDVVLGSPALDVSIAKRSIVYYKNLPKLVERINELEKQLKKINEQK